MWVKQRLILTKINMIDKIVVATIGGVEGLTRNGQNLRHSLLLFSPTIKGFGSILHPLLFAT